MKNEYIARACMFVFTLREWAHTIMRPQNWNWIPCSVDFYDSYYYYYSHMREEEKKNKHIHITRIKWQPNLPQMWVKGTAINELSTHPVGAQCTYLFRLFFFFFLSLLIFFISATLFILFHYNDCNVCFTVFFCHSN